MLVHVAAAISLVVKLASCVSNVSSVGEDRGPPLQLSFLNDLRSNASLSVYVTGYDDNGLLKVLDSTGCWVYPAASNQTTAIPMANDLRLSIGTAQTITNISLVGPLISGRIWVGQGAFQLSIIGGSDGRTTLVPPSPAKVTTPFDGTVWGFVELTYDRANSLWVNLSYVDFVGLALRLALHNADGTVQYAHGLSSGAVDDICTSLRNQSHVDGQPWAQLCMYDGDQHAVSIVSPNMLISTNASAFADYWTAYVNEVWARFEREPLVLDTQGVAGIVHCSTQTGDLWCQNEVLTRPSAADIFSCNSGPFDPRLSDSILRRAVVARLCAAINRSTLLHRDGSAQPGSNASTFYSTSPTNHYSRLIHEHEIGHIGYAFPYDDVFGRQDANPANVLVSSSASTLMVLIER